MHRCRQTTTHTFGLPGTRSQLINSIDILRARRATGLMTRDNYRTVNNITLGKYPEAK
ncbi:TPA: toxin YeeV [Escherichia coli]|nr:toxin YeeV [Escherichia coli]EFM3167413.1 toxin YeeV [Escherichia coli]EFO4105534.1 toxin YeeV [Escherichia coli]EFS3089639.1 toxin YeeV [Escherichia coli]EHD1185917.1 toxin YeeV [Escherichia coli]